jgi:hypothetical protein
MIGSVRDSGWTSFVRCCLGLAVIVGPVSGPTTTAASAASPQLGAATVGQPAARSGGPIDLRESDLNGGGNYKAEYKADWNVIAAQGWSYEASGAAERFVAQATHVECHAGGESASTHYARVRRKLPERDGVAIRKRFSIEGNFELPADFYARHESYMRVITVENTLASYRSTGTTVGTSTGDEWRVGFTIYGSDQLFRLISDHENHSNIVLWKAASRLPTGTHAVRIDFVPSRTTGGSWGLYIDGARVGSGTNVQTVPASVDPTDVVVTRANGCIDGASQQDNASVQVNLHSLSIRGDT